MADVFSKHARRKVNVLFGQVFGNDDVATYKLAQEVLKGQHEWLEDGIVRL